MNLSFTIMRRFLWPWLIGSMLTSCGETEYERKQRGESELRQRERNGENEQWERRKTILQEWQSRHADVVEFKDQFRESLTLEVQDSIVANADKRFWIEFSFGHWDLHRQGEKHILTMFWHNNLFSIECSADQAARLVSYRKRNRSPLKTLFPDFILLFTLASAVPLEVALDADTEGSGENISAYVVMNAFSGKHFTGTLIDFLGLQD